MEILVISIILAFILFAVWSLLQDKKAYAERILRVNKDNEIAKTKAEADKGFSVRVFIRLLNGDSITFYKKFEGKALDISLSQLIVLNYISSEDQFKYYKEKFYCKNSEQGLHIEGDKTQESKIIPLSAILSVTFKKV
jgi:hypothetical protein